MTELPENMKDVHKVLERGRKLLRENELSASPACSTPLLNAITALEGYEQLPTLMDKLQYCQHPQWHTLLKALVIELINQPGQV